jgi:hypothetical protein
MNSSRACREFHPSPGPVFAPPQALHLAAASEAIRLSRSTLRTIKQSLGWAFGYKLVALPLAAVGLLNPVVASAAMALSSLSVSNALRLRLQIGPSRRDHAERRCP